MRAASVMLCGVRIPATTSSPLGIDEEFAVKLLLAGRGIAGEGDAGRGRIAEIAEDHGLHIDGRAPGCGNIVQMAIGDGTRVHPAGKHRADRAPELHFRILRESVPELLLDHGLVERDDMLPLDGGKIGIVLMAETGLLVLEDFLENLVVETHDDIGIHLDEAAIAVPGKTRIAGIVAERLHGLVVETEIEDGIHHARHRGARAGAHGEQQRPSAIAELAPGDRLHLLQPLHHLRLQVFGNVATILVVEATGFADDRQTGRNRQAETAHFGKIGTLAPEPLIIPCATLGLPVAECINPLRHFPPSNSQG